MISAMKKAFLILADGAVFEGVSVGADGQVIGEVIFTTAIANYVEALTDPSYADMLLCMTNTQIGNVGVNQEDNQSDEVYASGMIMRQMCKRPSNWRCEGEFGDYLKQKKILAIADIDTRELTRTIREKGSQMAMLTTDPNALFDINFVLTEIANYKKPERCINKRANIAGGGKRVAVIDLGIKDSVVEGLTTHGFDITFFDRNATSEQILQSMPDGVFISNGSGRPSDEPNAVLAVGELFDRNIPMFGVDLGHLVMAAAMGMGIEKMHFGHNGANQPVNDFDTNRTYITTQTHQYMVPKSSFNASVARITHENNNDFSIEGIAYTGKPAISVQFIPNAAPGVDTAYLYKTFEDIMDGGNK